MMPGALDDVRAFVDQVTARLDHGQQAYGGQSPVRPVAATVEALLLEQLDVVGWLAVLWVQAARKTDLARDPASLRARFLTQLEHRIRRNDRRTAADVVAAPASCMAELEVLAMDQFLAHADLRRRLLPIARAIEVAQSVRAGPPATTDVRGGRRGSISDPRSSD
jgi:hypothetical protein